MHHLAHHFIFAIGRNHFEVQLAVVEQYGFTRFYVSRKALVVGLHALSGANLCGGCDNDACTIDELNAVVFNLANTQFRTL